jgi:hypothetical protein
MRRPKAKSIMRPGPVAAPAGPFQHSSPRRLPVLEEPAALVVPLPTPVQAESSEMPKPKEVSTDE